MPRPAYALAAALSGALALSSAAVAADTSAGPLRITHPWIAATPASAPTAAGYLSIANTGRVPDVLIGAASPAAAAVQVHQMSLSNGIMHMRAVVGGVAIAPGRTLTLSPNMSPGGGYHLMLIGPKRPFKAGERVPVTLRFRRAGAVRVVFDVTPPGGPAGAPPMKMGGMR